MNKCTWRGIRVNGSTDKKVDGVATWAGMYNIPTLLQKRCNCSIKMAGGNLVNFLDIHDNKFIYVCDDCIECLHLELVIPKLIATL